MSQEEKLFIEHAKASDKKRIFSMCDNVYDGFDYLEHVFDAWIKEPLSMRHSIVLKRQSTGEIVGFQSFCIQNGGKMALQQAIRISDNARGSGIGRKFYEMGDEYLKAVFGKITLLKVFCSDYAPKKATEGQSLVIKQPCSILLFHASHALKIQGQLRKELHDFQPDQLQQENFLSLLQDCKLPLCMNNDFLHVDWVVYHKTDLQLFLTMNQTNHKILAESDCVSILALPINVPMGQRSSVGIYCLESVEMIRVLSHLKKQLLTLIEYGLNENVTLTVTSNLSNVEEAAVHYLKEIISAVYFWDKSDNHSILLVSKAL